MSDPIFLVFYLLVLIFSVMIHEISHGVVAEYLGDPTARFAGRLTLNPISHIDPIGSVLLPLTLWFLSHGTVMFGWAKPVPYDPRNLPNPKTGAGKIAAAGPLSNLLLAVVFGIFLRASAVVPVLLPVTPLFTVIVVVNIALAVFNLVPIPPLDGSKVLFAFLPTTHDTIRFMRFLETYGIFILLIIIFVIPTSILAPIIGAIYRLIVGSPLF